MYEIFRKEYEIKAKVEASIFNQDLEKVYLSVLNNKLIADLRSFNYKVLFEALYTKDKFQQRNEDKYFLCNTAKETVNHLNF